MTHSSGKGTTARGGVAPDPQHDHLDGARIEIPLWSSAYPELLRNIDDPPETLYVLGNEQALAPGLAIVGARKATPYGLGCAQHFAQLAASRGIPIVSGGAMGCDQAAHKGALEAGGTTVAVLGGGADTVYPRAGKPLFERMLAGVGALVSEQPWGAPPLRWAFRQRNRIIAGLSKAVLIVEAGLPSGTFSTADFALNAGREVLVVPGSLFSRESYGSNTLLRQGAIPIIDDSSFSETLDSLFDPVLCLRTPASRGDAPDGVGERVLRVLAASPTVPDELVGIAGKDIMQVVRVLSTLESQGEVQRYPDGRFGLGARAMARFEMR